MKMRKDLPVIYLAIGEDFKPYPARNYIHDNVLCKTYCFNILELVNGKGLALCESYCVDRRCVFQMEGLWKVSDISEMLSIADTHEWPDESTLAILAEIAKIYSSEITDKSVILSEDKLFSFDEVQEEDNDEFDDDDEDDSDNEIDEGLHINVLRLEILLKENDLLMTKTEKLKKVNEIYTEFTNRLTKNNALLTDQVAKLKKDNEIHTEFTNRLTKENLNLKTKYQNAITECIKLQSLLNKEQVAAEEECDTCSVAALIEDELQIPHTTTNNLLALANNFEWPVDVYLSIISEIRHIIDEDNTYSSYNIKIPTEKTFAFDYKNDVERVVNFVNPPSSRINDKPKDSYEQLLKNYNMNLKEIKLLEATNKNLMKDNAALRVALENMQKEKQKTADNISKNTRIINQWQKLIQKAIRNIQLDLD